jgi:antitoxin HicB
MTKKSPHWGTTLDAFLDAEGICQAAKAEAVTEWLPGSLPGKWNVRASSPRRPGRKAAHQPLPGGQGNNTIETLQRAVALIRRELRLELVLKEGRGCRLGRLRRPVGSDNYLHPPAAGLPPRRGVRLRSLPQSPVFGRVAVT